MQWPAEIGVMVLPNVILFPQAFLPLYVFEPRYRKMLADSLTSHRLFCVALQHPARSRESPTGVAGLGLVRACRQHADGTAHLILQGLARVELAKATRYRPYRVHPIQPLESQVVDTVAADALAARLLEVVSEQLRKGPLILPGVATAAAPENLPSPQKGIEFLAHVNSPEQIADLVSWALLANPSERQLLLETLDVETRLRRLIQFLLAQQNDTDS